MAQVINTNIASLNAQRNLNKSQNSLSTSLQRLSSGMRINSAKDDAAGLAISQRFTAQIRGLNQAARNSNDGISLAQTAEGALGEVTNNLQRIRELAVQSTNATNSSSDRVAMQQEVSQLIAEIDRVAGQTNFNGVKLLDGSFSSQNFQVGANVGETITVSSIVNSTKIGLSLGTANASATGSSPVGSLAAGDLTINGVSVGASTRDAKAIATAITSALSAKSVTGITATVSASSIDTGTFTAITTTGTGASLTIQIGTVSAITVTGAGATVTAAEVSSKITSSATAITAGGITVSGTASGGDLTFGKADGSNVTVTIAVTGAATGGFSIGSTATGYGAISLVSSSSTGDLVIAGDKASSAGFTAGTTYNTLSVTTVSLANSLITAVDTALDTVNGSRATLGAIQNRFESVVTSLQTSSESLSAARSRIQDTDFAAETANLTKAQILQQAGMAMMAQANSLPQNVLSLLQ